MSLSASRLAALTARNEAIASSFDEGRTVDEIVTLFGVKRDRVRFILRAAGRGLAPITSDPTFATRALQVAAELAGANVTQIRSSWRAPPELVRARWAYMSAMRKRGVSFPQIGKRISRDHATVMYGCRQADYFAARSPEFAEMLAKVDAA